MLAVFGASATTGKILVRQALEQGYAVTAYARNPAKLNITHPGVKVVQGELQDLPAISRAVEGADAVISLLGPTGRVKGRPVSEGMANIIAAMRGKEVQRLVPTATPSAPDPKDSFDFGFRLAVKMVKLTMGDAYADIVGTEAVIRDSGLDWTIVRLPLLSNKPKTGIVKTWYLGDRKIKLSSVSRGDLADFLLAQVNEPKFLHQAPVINN
ncbi:MAG TPA: SDR family oxidoreductase [Candidatus Limnocylindrales bacterium]|nr:SDR family oxidoreductase [Candidatus Limnocylindrales bacterium]